jgi:hypothetical protein
MPFFLKRKGRGFQGGRKPLYGGEYSEVFLRRFPQKGWEIYGILIIEHFRCCLLHLSCFLHLKRGIQVFCKHPFRGLESNRFSPRSPFLDFRQLNPFFLFFKP